jgi:transaldolase
VNVNVTLLFSVQRYEDVIEAYLRGLERRVRSGEPLAGIASVASFFVSRVDTKAEALLPGGSPLRGRIAIANAHRAYGRYLARFSGERWAALAAHEARTQRPLWASTGTKNPAYSDVLYVEQLIAPDVINTMPRQTLDAFAEHGNVERALDTNLSEAERDPRAGGRRRDRPLDADRRARARRRRLVLRLLPGAAGLHPDQAHRGRRLTG